MADLVLSARCCSGLDVEVQASRRTEVGRNVFVSDEADGDVKGVRMGVPGHLDTPNAYRPCKRNSVGEQCAADSSSCPVRVDKQVDDLGRRRPRSIVAGLSAVASPRRTAPSVLTTSFSDLATRVWKVHPAVVPVEEDPEQGGLRLGGPGGPIVTRAAPMGIRSRPSRPLTWPSASAPNTPSSAARSRNASSK